MLTRRQGLTMAGAGSAAAFMGIGRSERAVAQAGAPTVKTPVNFAVPAGACDCHVHVFDPQKFPYWSGRAYTPPPATAAELEAVENALHMQRTVIVTPSIYGTDNRATLDGIRQLGPNRARGVAVIDQNTSAADLDAMHQGGIRGVRINLEQAGVFDPGVSAKKLDDTVKQIAGRPWHLEMFSRLSVISALKPRFEALPIPVVFDHFGGAQGALGPEQPGFDALLDLVRSGKAYVTISGAYRASERAPDYADVAPLARKLIATNPDRLIWGSDWPHPDSAVLPNRKATDPAPALPIDDGRVLNLLAEWAPDAAVRSKILVDNPKRLYDF